MRRALLLKNKHKFIDDAWELYNMMFISWITALECPDCRVSYTLKTKRICGTTCVNDFSKGDHFRISDLLQGERIVTEFFTDLKALWEELESLRQTPDCTCEVKCSCDLVRSIRKWIRHVFFKGLNDVYITVKTQISLMEPLPKINRVFSLVVEQEQQLTGNTIGSNKVLVNTAGN